LLPQRRFCRHQPDHEFMVVDRGGEGANLEEIYFPETAEVIIDL
jgi:hypothetical protein